MRNISVLAHTIGTPWLFFITTTAIAVLLYFFEKPTHVLIFVLTFVLVIGIVGLLKIIFKTPRPENAYETLNSFAFPSGHAAGVSFLSVYSTYFAFLYLEPLLAWTLSLLGMFVALIVSISRAVLHVHTTFQVLIGVSIGIFIPTLILLYQEKIISYVFTTLPNL